MSKRAKEAALKALPNYPPETYADEDEYIEVESVRSVQRAFYRKGYEQAEKDTIERAVTWLKDNANKYIVDLTETYPDAPVNIIVGGMCWEDLTKYLKDNEQH